MNIRHYIETARLLILGPTREESEHAEATLDKLWEELMSVKNHIILGAKCCLCEKEPAIGLTRVVYRDDNMPQDAMLWGGACCWDCSKLVGGFIQYHIEQGDFR